MKNHIKNYIKIMGLAAVPFGTAQAEDYEIKVASKLEGDSIYRATAVFVYSGDMKVFSKSHGPMDYWGGFPLSRGGRLLTVGGRCGWTFLRGLHDEEGGEVAVTDAKFSGGRSITREDVEAQWKKEEVGFRDTCHRLLMDEEGPRRVFTVDCKMYNLTKGCSVEHFFMFKNGFLNFFLVQDPQRSLGGFKNTLVIVVPDDCENVVVRSAGIPTVVCGGKVKGLVSDNEILDPSVRSRLLSTLGQKELSVKSWAAISESKTDIQSKTDAPKVLLKDCPFVQQAKVVGQMRRGSKMWPFIGIWERLRGEFCLTGNGYEELPEGYLSVFESDVKYYFKKHVREEFLKLLHRGAKHNAVCHIKALAKDNAVRCIEDLKEKLKKLEGKLKKVSEKEKLKK